MRLLTQAVLLALLGAAPSQAADLGDLGWLLGCWRSEDGSAQEAWVEETDGSLVGFAVVVDGGRVAFYEILTIAIGADGELVYTAHPEGASRTEFVLTKLGASDVLFSNPDHDYPQEIGYRLDDDTLVATISLLDGERPRSFPKQRCD